MLYRLPLALLCMLWRMWSCFGDISSPLVNSSPSQDSLCILIQTLDERQCVEILAADLIWRQTEAQNALILELTRLSVSHPSYSGLGYWSYFPCCHEPEHTDLTLLCMLKPMQLQKRNPIKGAYRATVWSV